MTSFQDGLEKSRLYTVCLDSNETGTYLYKRLNDEEKGNGWPFQIICEVPINSIVMLLEQKNGFYKVLYGDKIGFIDCLLVETYSEKQ